MRLHAIACDLMQSHAIAILCNRMKSQTLCLQLSKFFFDAHRCAPSPQTAIHIRSNVGGCTNLAAAAAAWQHRRQLGGSEGSSTAALAALARRQRPAALAALARQQQRNLLASLNNTLSYYLRFSTTNLLSATENTNSLPLLLLSTANC